MSRWDQVREKIARMKTLDDTFMLVGSNVHRYALVDPMAPAELAAWEDENVALPVEYRSFLLEVGASGPGPGEGLLPLGATWPSQGDPKLPYVRGKLDGVIPLCRYDPNGFDVLVVGDSQVVGTVWSLQSNLLDDWNKPDGSGFMRFDDWYLGWLTQIGMALEG